MLRPSNQHFLIASCLLVSMFSGACQNSESKAENSGNSEISDSANAKYLSQPLVSHIYTADPSAHVFENKIYIYPSHDIDAGVPEKDDGAHFAMRDYHVLSMDSINGQVKDNGVALDIKDIPWAGRQLWAPDAAFKNGKYYLYFPVKDKKDEFKIGVATSTSPIGPFKAEPQPIKGSFSIDPAVFTDTDGTSYMYFGGIWGGQLQRWASGKYDSTAKPEPDSNKVALSPKMAKLSNDMLTFEGGVKDLKIIDAIYLAVKTGKKVDLKL